MTWTSYLILLELTVNNWCNNLPAYYYIDTCNEDVMECVLDGEDIEFCQSVYFEENFDGIFTYRQFI